MWEKDKAMRDLEDAGRMIAAELAQKGLDRGDIEVRESGVDRYLLVRPAEWPIAMEHKPSVDRDTMTPTTAMQISNYLTVHDGYAERAAAMAGKASRQIDELDEITGCHSEIALQEVTEMGSASPQFTLALYADLLDNTLKRARHQIPMRGLLAQDCVKKIVATERNRRKLVDDAGGRPEALKICSVAAAAIRAEPGRWRDRVKSALGKGKQDLGVDGFRDGVWLPLVQLDNAGRVRWRRDSLIVREGMPQTLQAAIIDKPLSAVVEHPWLPKDAVVHWTNQRMNEELHIHTAERVNRTREAWETAHIEPFAPLLPLLGVALR